MNGLFSGAFTCCESKTSWSLKIMVSKLESAFPPTFRCNMLVFGGVLGGSSQDLQVVSNLHWTSHLNMAIWKGCHNPTTMGTSELTMGQLTTYVRHGMILQAICGVVDLWSPVTLKICKALSVTLSVVTWFHWFPKKARCLHGVFFLKGGVVWEGGGGIGALTVLLWSFSLFYSSLVK